ncbi:hypothetical protein [Streptomyces sp. NPDC048720]|uniref:hypothetical protein n=1 Tax=Streptomyces sp. NPDC048720 TaxID=3365588 RepID=UPI003716984D
MTVVNSSTVGELILGTASFTSALSASLKWREPLVLFRSQSTTEALRVTKTQLKTPISFTLSLGKSMTQLASFCVTVIALSLIATLIIQVQQKQIQKLMEQNRILTNLAASKNLEAFHQIQATTKSQQLQSEDEPVNPLNDEAVAHALAEKYKQQGLDPNYAYAQDETNFASEFGL